MNEATGGEPAIGVSYSVQVGDGRNLVFQSHISSLCSQEEQDQFIDRLRKTADRNVGFGKLEAMDHEIELKKRIIRQVEMSIMALDAGAKHLPTISAQQGEGRRYPKKASDAEEQQRKNAVVQLESEKKALGELIKMRDDFRESLG